MADSKPRPTLRITSWLLAGLILLSGGSRAQEDFQIVLRVNDRIATSWDYQRRRAEKMQMIQAAESLSAERRQRMLANIGVSTMDDLFEELLMLSRADQLGIRVSEADLDRGVDNARRNSGIETEEQFGQALQASNLTLEQFRSNMSRSLLVQKLMSEEVHPRITLEEEDLRRYYQNHTDEFLEPERIKLEEVVFLSSSGLSAEELEAAARQVQTEVRSGTPLTEAVESYAAEGISSGAVDLGWVEVGDLDPELEEAVWALEAGAVSEPVSGRGGLHLLLATDRREAHLQSFAEVEQAIRAKEGERLLNSEMQKYLEELEATAYVVVNPPPDAVGFRASLQLSSDSDELERALTAPLIAEPLGPLQAEGTPEEPEAADEPEPEEPPNL